MPLKNQTAKKLLVVNSRFLPLIGGAETYTMELMRHFSEMGWEVHLVTQERGFGQTTWEGCYIHYIDGFVNNNQSIYKCAPMLRGVLDTVKPDLVHVHNIMPFFAYGSVVEAGEFPCVLTLHDTPVIPERVFGFFGDFAAERAFTRQLLANQKYDHILVGSKHYLEKYIEIAPWIRKKAEIAYYFPPSMSAGPMEEKPLNFGDRVTLLFPSRIVKMKGIEEVLHALARLPERFVLSLPAHAEDESYRKDIDGLIRKLGLTNRIFTPSEVVTPETMGKLYREADIVLMTSYYEGFGIAAVEAMSWGVPVIASEVGGLKEIIQHGKNGLHIKPQDVDGLMKAITYLANNPDKARVLALGGIKTVQQKFNRTKHMRQIERIYRKVLRKKQGIWKLSDQTKAAAKEVKPPLGQEHLLTSQATQPIRRTP